MGLCEVEQWSRSLPASLSSLPEYFLLLIVLNQLLPSSPLSKIPFAHAASNQPSQDLLSFKYSLKKKEMKSCSEDEQRTAMCGKHVTVVRQYLAVLMCGVRKEDKELHQKHFSNCIWSKTSMHLQGRKSALVRQFS